MDLGSGDCERAKILVEIGASSVLAVDKQRYRAMPPGVLPFAAYFDQALARIVAFAPEVAYLAWPANNPCRGLREILEVVPVVVYVGSNTRGSSCGVPSLFRLLRGREVLCHVPDERNTLLVYGATLPEPRADVYHEELTGLTPGEEPLAYNGTGKTFMLP